MMKNLAIIALTLPIFATQADVILISDNRSVHAEGLETDTALNSPFNVTSTPSAAFADFIGAAGGGSSFGSGGTFQNSTLSTTELALGAGANANFLGLLPGGTSARTAQYLFVNTFDVTFQITTPQDFILTATGGTTDLGHTTTRTLLGNFTKDGNPFLLPVDRSITPLDPVSLAGVLDPGIYHLKIENIMAGSGSGSDVVKSDAFGVASLKFVPDSGSNVALLGIGLVGLFLPRLRKI